MAIGLIVQNINRKRRSPNATFQFESCEQRIQKLSANQQHVIPLFVDIDYILGYDDAELIQPLLQPD